MRYDLSIDLFEEMLLSDSKIKDSELRLTHKNTGFILKFVGIHRNHNFKKFQYIDQTGITHSVDLNMMSDLLIDEKGVVTIKRGMKLAGFTGVEKYIKKCKGKKLIRLTTYLEVDKTFNTLLVIANSKKEAVDMAIKLNDREKDVYVGMSFDTEILSWDLDHGVVDLSSMQLGINREL